ncbi:MAG: hypothetical protein AAB340_01215 [Patescibacteria group bacterium]
MINFNHPYKLDTKHQGIDYLFYFTSILLAATVFSYLIFNFKVQLQSQRIQDVEKESLNLVTGERRVFNNKVLDYKKKIDDFSTIINNHKVTSSVFSFIEENTLPDVWFSDFSMQGANNEINLSGQALNMEVLSRQVEIFERNQDYIESINVLESQTNSTGKVSFVLNLFFDSKIFNYGDPALKESLLENEVNP